MVAVLLLLLVLEAALRLAGMGHNLSFTLRERVAGGDRVHDNVFFGLICFPRQLARQTPHFAVDPELDAVRIVVLGESAAMGDPMPEFGFPRQLQAVLRAQHPDQRIEVLNAAMTAIDSHVIRRIAADLRPLRPDVVVIYAGNNEIIGPFGPGARWGRGALPVPSSRIALALRATRLGQLAAGAVDRARGDSSSAARWRGLALFDERQFAADDPAVDAAHRRFASNLRDIVDLSRRAGAKVCLATMAVNARMAPFASPHPGQIGARGAPPTGRGVRREVGGDLPIADPGQAETHYRRARALDAEGRIDEARAAFARARDLDKLRVRADSGILAATRAHAAEADALVDADEALSGEPDLFLDHVHLGFRGNYRLARLVADGLAPLIPRAANAPPAEEAVARTLAFTPDDEAELIARMGARLSQRPYVGQSDHAQRMRAMRDRLRELRAQRLAPAERLARIDEALAATPDDVELRVRRGAMLEELARPADAVAEYKRVLAAMPHHTRAHQALGRALTLQGDTERGLAHYRLGSPLAAHPEAEALASAGSALAEAGRSREAEALLRRACAMDPRHTIAHYNLGLLYARDGRSDDAFAQYETVLHLDPAFTEARNNLAILLLQKNRTDDAIAQLRRVVEENPGHVSAWRNLAAAYAAAGRRADAAAALRRVLDLTPDDAEARRALGTLVD